MHDIIDHPQWTRETDDAYARWYQAQPVDPAVIYRDPRVAFALCAELIEPAEVADYLTLPIEYLRADGVPPLSLV